MLSSHLSIHPLSQLKTGSLGSAEVDKSALTCDGGRVAVDSSQDIGRYFVDDELQSTSVCIETSLQSSRGLEKPRFSWKTVFLL